MIIAAFACFLEELCELHELGEIFLQLHTVEAILRDYCDTVASVAYAE